MNGTLVSEKLVDMTRCPVPRVFVGGLEESPHKALSLLDRLETQISAELLVTPPIEHFLHDLVFRMKQRNRSISRCSTN
ncbi:hypothetical protein [Cryobacterium sp. CG_9.6]|uniref:hypothetical protein n=1 Tax=Cryobacterium sp. CG_9.6 TaxID=2760710 RepID=UPI002475B54B|nr:hypothetical protein [Cryobacterium sp. CG_9.6]MDH6238541.1 hypothetical protein [Cryobacterium sp. CG_9.6]